MYLVLRVLKKFPNNFKDFDKVKLQYIQKILKRIIVNNNV